MTLIGEVPSGLAATAARIGDGTTVLDEDHVARFVHDQLADYPFDGRSVCVLVPDATRTCPLPLLMRAVHGALHGRVSTLTVLIALGTHGEMSEQALADHLGYPPGRLADTYPDTTVVNHEWWKPETFVDLGTIPASRIAELSEGRMSLDVPVLLNRAVVEHDIALVLGPVLPHEVVGISGGNKYFFPGVGGQQIIDVSHWLGALITSAEIIGTTGITPVRALIDDGAALIPAEKIALCAVTAETEDGAADSAIGSTVTSPVRTSGLHSLSFGDTVASWASAAEVCAATHVTYLDAPVRRVFSIVPQMYDDIWTAAKGFYKVEPVVADDGEVILYAPHVTRTVRVAPGDLRDRLPLPRLLREAVGPLRVGALGCAGPLDAPAGRRHLRRRHGRGAAARAGHAGHADPRGCLPRSQSRIPRSGTRWTSRCSRTTPTRWWCRGRARCSSGCAEPTQNRPQFGVVGTPLNRSAIHCIARSPSTSIGRAWLIIALLRNGGSSLVQNSTSAPWAHQSRPSWLAAVHGTSGSYRLLSISTGALGLQRPSRCSSNSA